MLSQVAIARFAGRVGYVCDGSDIRCARYHFFFPCTFEATFSLSAFSRMKPVASSWL